MTDFPNSKAIRLVEETEAHVVVGLLLLLLLGSLGRGFLSGTTSRGTTCGGSTTGTTRWDRGELGRTLSDELRGVLVGDCLEQGAR